MSSHKKCVKWESSSSDDATSGSVGDLAFNKSKSGSNDVLNYSYSKLIKGPGTDDGGYGFSSKGSKITHNMEGILKYIRLLIEGNAMVKSGATIPLGINTFTPTGSTCKDSKTGKTVARSTYFHGQPTGNIPFLSSAAGASFPKLQGLIPSMIETSTKVIPTGILDAFSQGTTPSCSETRMITIDASGNKHVTSAYVLDSEVKALDPCYFAAPQTGKFSIKSKEISAKKRKNPLTGTTCEGFNNIKPAEINKSSLDYSKVPDDNFIKAYYIALSALLMYLVTKIYLKKR